METEHLILDYLRVFLSWPVITLVLGLFFFFLFKESIENFFSRITRGEAYGVKVEASTPSDQRKEAVEQPNLPQAEDEVVRYIQSNPETVRDEYFRVFNAFRFERGYNLIFGTQINILEHLAERGEDGDKYVNLVPFYNDFAHKIGDNKTEMADYIGFLHDMGFVEYSGEGTDISVKITPLGINFLSYIKKQYPVGYKYKAF